MDKVSRRLSRPDHGFRPSASGAPVVAGGVAGKGAVHDAPADLRRKILQSADELRRTVAVRRAYAR